MDAVDHQVLEAVRRRWQADSVLPALHDRAPGAGRLHSPREQPLPDSYGQMDCEPLRTQRYTKAVVLETRKVTLRCYGPKDKAQAALARLHLVFTERMGSPASPGLLFGQAGWRFVGWLHVQGGAGGLAEDPVQREGQDVWIGTLEAECSFSRPEGS